MEFTTFSLAGKTLVVLHYLGPRQAAGLDGTVHDEESTTRTAAAIGRAIGMRGNNINKALRELKEEGCAEQVDSTRGRGSRWQITLKGVRTIRRLWQHDLATEVVVGQTRVPMSKVIHMIINKFGCENSPEGLIRVVVDRGWLPYLHGNKQNSQRSRERYDPFGYAFTASGHEGQQIATEVAAIAIAALLGFHSKESLNEASSIAFFLLRSRSDPVSLLLSLASNLETIGVAPKTIKALVELLGSGEVPDRDLRVAAYDALLRMLASTSAKGG